jgi:hypothetical protein
MGGSVTGSGADGNLGESRRDRPVAGAKCFPLEEAAVDRLRHRPG